MVISINSVQVTKVPSGGLKISCKCPNCGEKLTTNEEMALGTETCPSCSQSFVFDESVRQKLLARKKMKQERAQIKEDQELQEVLVAEPKTKHKIHYRNKREAGSGGKQEQWMGGQKQAKNEDIYGDYPALRLYQGIGTVALGMVGVVMCIAFIGFVHALFSKTIVEAGIALGSVIFLASLAVAIGAGRELIKVFVRIECNTRSVTRSA